MQKREDDNSSTRSFFKRVRKFLKSHVFHSIVISLVVADCLFVSSEIVIDYLSKALFENQGPSTHLTANKTMHHIPPHEHKEGKLHLTLEIIEHILEYLTLIVSGLFVVEILIKLIFIPKVFLKPIEIFDAIVVFVTFSINLTLFIRTKHGHHLSIAILICLLRLWRITEIINSIAQTIEAKQEKKVSMLEDRIEELEHENQLLKRDLSSH